MRLQSDLEYVLDHWSEEHSVGVSTDKTNTQQVASLHKAANIAEHIKERVDHALILIHSVVESEIGLKVRCWVYRAQSLVRWGVHGQKVVILCLVLCPEHKVRIFKLDFVVVEGYLLAHMLHPVELIIEKKIA